MQHNFLRIQTSAFLLLAPAMMAMIVARASGAEPGSSIPAVAERLELAPEDANERTVGNYIGSGIVDRGGRELGQIHDFLVGERSSQLVFVVVSTGGFLGIGETLRLLPIRALKTSSNAKRFDIGLDRQEFRELRSIGEDDLAAGRIAVTGESISVVQPGDSSPTARSAPDAPGSVNPDERLIRASIPGGKNVRVGGREAGEIESVVLDFGAETARALLDPDLELSGTGEKVLVPFGKLIFAEQGERLVGTRLTRSDFNALVPSWNQTTGPHQPPAVAERHREQRGLPPLTDPNPVDRRVTPE